MSAPDLGQTFAGKYRIARQLGVGSMGTVYLAHHEVLRRQVAVKVLHDSLLADTDVAERFRREAMATSRLEHPHITGVFDFGYTDSGTPYIVMEYVDGPDLNEVIRSHYPFSVERALLLMGQMADALAAAHAARVIHRDLKPKNVIVTKQGSADHIKILDFGLAKIIDIDALTIKGQAFGTPHYMAPEQCSGGETDHRADIYSFGILSFEMLVGHVPFRGTLMEVINAQIDTAPPIPSAARQDNSIPPALDEIILRCLKKRKEDRYPTANELSAAIMRLLPAAGSTPPRHEQAITAEVSLPATSPILSSDAHASGGLTDAERFSSAEQLALALARRGSGAAEVARALIEKILAEDRVHALEASINLLETRIVAAEGASRRRRERIKALLRALRQDQESESADVSQEIITRLEKRLREIESALLSETAAINEDILETAKKLSDARSRLGTAEATMTFEIRGVIPRLEEPDTELGALISKFEDSAGQQTMPLWRDALKNHG